MLTQDFVTVTKLIEMVGLKCVEVFPQNVLKGTQQQSKTTLTKTPHTYLLQVKKKVREFNKSLVRLLLCCTSSDYSKAQSADPSSLSSPCCLTLNN